MPYKYTKIKQSLTVKNLEHFLILRNALFLKHKPKETNFP